MWRRKLIKYRVILKESDSSKNGIDDSELILGLVSSKVQNSKVRLARNATRTNGNLEIRLGKFVAVGLAVAGLMGSVADEAEASVCARMQFPDAIKSESSGFVPWNGWNEDDRSVEAIPSLPNLPSDTSKNRGIIAVDPSGMHSNGDVGHSNVPPSGQHTNSDWTNHTNNGSGHTNGPWWNHVNSDAGSTGHSNGTPYEFNHVNVVQGDYIF